MSLEPDAVEKPAKLEPDPDKPSVAQLVGMARKDLWCFIELTFSVLHPGKPLIYADYLELMAQIMMKVRDGKWRRVIVNLPPRHMKSMIISIFYVAWRLGVDPTTKFITISYGDDLAHDHSALTRKLMTSPLYKRIFPGTILEKKAVDHIVTTKGGARYATSIGSDITGFGADVIIIDDPMQPDQATSERVKQDVRQWVSSSVMTRFNDPAKGVLILVMHRLAPDDLSATLSETADFVLTLPLVAGKDEPYYTLHDRILCLRREGDILNPNRMGPKEADALKQSLPKHVWNSQYQQQPTAGGSGMLSIDHFQRFDLGKPPAFELVIHSWDLGATINGNASVCTQWGLTRSKEGCDLLYLTNVVRIKLELPEVRATIEAEMHKHDPALVVLDERGAGMGVYQDLRNQHGRKIMGSTETDQPPKLAGSKQSHPGASKIDRFGRASLVIGDRTVFIPHKAPWLETFLYEVAAFPNAPDDDQVDSMTQVIANFKRAIYLARKNAADSLAY